MPADQGFTNHTRTRKLAKRLQTNDYASDIRVNLLPKPLSGSAADYPVNGDVTFSTTLNLLGIQGGVVFIDNALSRFAYKSFATLAGKTYRMSALIRMDDNAKPVNSNASVTGDFSFVVDGSIIGTILQPILIAGNVWRCGMDYLSAGALANNGVIKFNTQSARGFVATDYHLQVMT